MTIATPANNTQPLLLNVSNTTLHVTPLDLAEIW